MGNATIIDNEFLMGKNLEEADRLFNTHNLVGAALGLPEPGF